MTAQDVGGHSAKLVVVIIRHTDIFASNISILPRKVFTHEGVTLLKWNQTDTAHTNVVIAEWQLTMDLGMETYAQNRCTRTINIKLFII
jgi:hypothetical protein